MGSRFTPLVSPLPRRKTFLPQQQVPEAGLPSGFCRPRRGDSQPPRTLSWVRRPTARLCPSPGAPPAPRLPGARRWGRSAALPLPARRRRDLGAPLLGAVAPGCLAPRHPPGMSKKSSLRGSQEPYGASGKCGLGFVGGFCLSFDAAFLKAESMI